MNSAAFFLSRKLVGITWIALWLFCGSVFAQTGLPLNFSQLPNPSAIPTSLIYLETDASIPLGDKTPLILIHGIDLFSGSPSQSAAGWTNFLFYFYNTPALNSRYKIYRVAYRSNQVSVATLGSYLDQVLDYNDGQLAQKNVVILAHSMGGLVARRLLDTQRQSNSQKWNQSTIRLITLATPHHGTPSANDVGYLGLPPFAVYFGALGTYLGNSLATLDYAAEASYANIYFWLSLPYNSANRSDLLWDNYDALFTSAFSPDERNGVTSTSTLNAIPSATAYDNKIFAYSGSIIDVSGGNNIGHL